LPQTFVSYIEHLQKELDGIRRDFDELLDRSSIRFVNPNSATSDMFFVGASDWGWAASDSDLAALQMKLLRRYEGWFQRVRLLFAYPTPALTEKLSDVDEFARRWISRPDEYDHDIPETIDRAKIVAAAKLKLFDELLEIAIKAGTSEVRLVPDTNALLRNRDLASYQRVLKSGFRVHLVPTVLQELDDLKDRGKSQDLRDKAQAVVRLLKGIRDKGDATKGVTVTKTITAQFDAREVDVQGVLEWLDPTVSDDRILATALRLQSEHPGGTVVLVTSDLNLQNKADAIGLPYIETPPAPATLRANLTASIQSSQGGPPRVTLTNDGPAVACGLTYSVSSSEPVGMRSTAGPWTLDELEVGCSDTQDLYGVYGAVVDLNAEWVDSEGSQSTKLPLDFPDRPPIRVPLARSIRPRR
jgi:rRNA maturation endonuclease Nob1